MQIRKVSAAEAARWPEATPPLRPTQTPAPAEVRMLLAALSDRRGITRIDRAGAAGGEHAWRGRVYTRNLELHKQFADSLYGGPAQSLAAAVAWRDSMRRIAGPRPPGPGQTPRIVRSEAGKHCGWIAYRAQGKRYFADSAWGGRDAAHATAARWLDGQEVTGRG